MAGFNFTPPGGPAQVQTAMGPTGGMPFQLLSPEMLAQIAQAAFRPPGGGGGMGMGGMGGGAPPPGMNFGGAAQGLGGLADAYVKWRGAGTGGAPGPGAMPGEDRATAPQWPPPMGDTGALTQPDFFNSSAWDKLGYGGGYGGASYGGGGFGGFGSGSASISPSFIGGGASGFGGG